MMMQMQTSMKNSTSTTYRGTGPQWATILDLPTELILMITQYLDEQHLRSLAIVYSSLHYLLLPLILKGLPEPEQLSSQTITLHNRDTMGALPILRRSPFVPSLKCLRCDLTYSAGSEGPNRAETIRNTLRIRFLVENVAKVEELWVRLPCPPHCDSASWKEAFAGLLHVMATKQCTRFTIVHGDSKMLMRPGFDPRPNHFGSFYITRMVKRLLGRKSGYVVDLNEGKPQNWMAWRLHPMPILTTFAIESPLFICPPFLDWMLWTLHQSSSSITTLHLSDGVCDKQWTQILPRIQLTALTDFKLTSTALDPIHLMGFVSRHPTITTLHFQPIAISYPQKLPSHRISGKFTFPHLAKLAAIPSFVSCLLTLGVNAYPLLQTVEILSSWYNFQPVDSATLYPVASVSLALESLTPICRARQMCLSLTFEGSTALKWLDITHGIRAERSLMVHHIILVAKDHYFNSIADTTIDMLLKWLGLFPALKHISFHFTTFERMAVRKRVAFIRLIRDACRLVETVTIGATTESVQAWLTRADYPSSQGEMS